jgi:prepilin-type processing-associated H-X9-DG protein
LVFGLYAAQNNSLLPSIDDRKNNFMFDANLVCPDYLTDTEILICPSGPNYEPEKAFRLNSPDDHPGFHEGDMHPDCVTDASYCYLGWQVRNDEEAKAFLEIYDKLAPEDYGKDIVDPEDGTVLFPALRFEESLAQNGMSASEEEAETAEGMYDPVEDPSLIPVIWDTPTTNYANMSHVPLGGNVLYLDGHIEHIKFGEKFPVTEIMARLLDERPREPIPDCEE